MTHILAQIKDKVPQTHAPPTNLSCPRFNLPTTLRNKTNRLSWLTLNPLLMAELVKEIIAEMTPMKNPQGKQGFPSTTGKISCPSHEGKICPNLSHILLWCVSLHLWGINCRLTEYLITFLCFFLFVSISSVLVPRIPTRTPRLFSTSTVINCVNIHNKVVLLNSTEIYRNQLS